ncbi:MAG TPA: hypothetical protein VKU00_13670 [Chthonomonadaceae bacterium]|nr:hypothetical protein [Chthonomonadaceae bacterium]
MAPPPEDVRFDTPHILYPIHRVEESAGSPNSGQQRQERRRRAPLPEEEQSEADPPDFVEVSSDYQAGATTPLSTHAEPDKRKAAGNPADPPPTPELHLDIKA